MFLRKVLLFIILSPFSFNLIFAQAPDTVWTKTLSGKPIWYSKTVYQTTDGGYITTGFITDDSLSIYNTYLAKTDLNGNMEWEKNYKGGLNTNGTSVLQASDGNFIVAGRSYPSGSGVDSAWLMKTDQAGNLLWRNFVPVYSGTALSVQETSDSCFVITGGIKITSTDSSKIFLSKFDTNGNILWTKTFYGGLGLEVRQTSDEGFIIVGRIVHSNTGYDAIFIRTDVSGNIVWTKNVASDGNFVDEVSSIRQTPDNGFIAAGYTGGFGVSGSSDMWVVRMNEDGDTLWTKVYGYNSSDAANCIEKTTDGNYIIAGYSYYGGFHKASLYKINLNGAVIWEKLLFAFSSQSTEAYSIQQTTDGGYIFAGKEMGDKIWLVKLSEDITDVDEYVNLSPKEFSLKQNYPNPFNPSTKISYQLSEAGFVTLRVYDILGNELTTLVNEEKSAGSYEVNFDASNLSNGVYFYRINAGSFTATKKMILLK